MPIRYSVITYMFGNYDRIRDPRITDPDSEYILVTDTERTDTGWKTIVDTRLSDKSPVYAAYYVRHHPFEYTDTDIVITVDASVQINDSLNDIVKEFDDSGADFGVMLNNFRDDTQKLKYWKSAYADRLDPTETEKLDRFLELTGGSSIRGSVSMAFSIRRNTRAMQRYNRHLWRYLLALGIAGKPNRLDEAVAHRLLTRYRGCLKTFPIALQSVQSTYMTHCEHGTDTPLPKYGNCDQMYYLCNEPVYPARYDKHDDYPRTYGCRTEAILLTRWLDEGRLREWLDWHLFHVGFDRAHVFDNESGYDVEGVCRGYGKRVTYERVKGYARQYRLYDTYINYRSSAEWVMPIDDDEYLDIGNFGNVYEAVSYYYRKFPHLDVLAVRWKNLFPESFGTERNGKVLDYCTREDPELAKKFMWLGDGTVKCLVRRCGPVHYEETWENPAGGHVPKHSCFHGALLPDGTNVSGCGYLDGPIQDERMRLLHCRYTGKSDWGQKYGSGNNTTVSDAVPHEKRHDLDKILGY